MKIKNEWVLIRTKDLENMEKSLAELEKLVHGCFYSHEQDASETGDFQVKQINGVYCFN